MSQLDDNATVVTVLEGSNFNVNVGESAKLQVNEAINYIKSGQAEIAETVGDITTAFNENAVEKTNQFNTNATNKTTAFNNNYTEKKNLIDAEVQTAETAATNASNSATSASNSADLAKQWAIGYPTEPTGYSAKYWAEEAASELISINAKIPAEASASNQLADKAYVDAEDNSLQSQIDAIVSSSDVFDIVGTYAELQAYDISTVPVNDIIKVLVDETHSGAATYYRCVEIGGVKSWSYIGSEGAYYTKAEADGKFVPQTRTVNGKALSSNITLTASDVSALPSSTTIPAKTSDLDNDSGFITSADLPTVGNATITLTQGGVTKGTFTTNQSGDATINLDAGGGGGGGGTWGSITGTLSDQTDLQNALNAKLNTSDVVEYTAAEVETLWGSI